jgi:N-acetylated-alpha-linked acidic dipeptidase
LENAVAALGKSSEHAFEIQENTGLNASQKENLNKMLYQAEQELLLDQGLPLRPWYKHVLYAPGYYTGYAVKTLPGIRESIEQRNYPEAETGIKQAAYAINKLAGYLSAL